MKYIFHHFYLGLVKSIKPAELDGNTKAENGAK